MVNDTFALGELTVADGCLSIGDSPYHSRVEVIKGDSTDRKVGFSDSTTYAFSLAPLEIALGASRYSIGPEMFFSVPGQFSLCLNSGDEILLIHKSHYTGIFRLGGPIERQGRLNYIDGCTDSLLIAPLRKGDPCFNHLHFPRHISQTMHTHPTARIGVVARGSGRCVTPAGEYPLRAGMTWHLVPEQPHCFFTDDSTLDVIAFHPDSDTGPDDEDHPMINRTYIDGVSANQIDAIKTKQFQARVIEA